MSWTKAILWPVIQGWNFDSFDFIFGLEDKNEISRCSTKINPKNDSKAFYEVFESPENRT